LADVGKYVVPPLLAALATVLVVNRVQAAVETGRVARKLRLRLRRALGVGKGLQPIHWVGVTDEAYEEIGYRLLALGDEAFEVSSSAGGSIHDAAQALDAVHTWLQRWEERKQNVDEIESQTGSGHPSVRRAVESAVYARDVMLSALWSVYNELGNADESLRHAAPRWTQLFREQQRVPTPAFRQAADMLSQVLDGRERELEDLTREWEELVRVEQAIAPAAPFQSLPGDEDVPRRVLRSPRS